MRLPAHTLKLSAAGLALWIASEGFSPTPHIPTKGDVPTIGYGSTRWEDGTRVTLADPPITRERAEALTLTLNEQGSGPFNRSLRGVYLYQSEYDLYHDFKEQFGIGNWLSSSMLRELRAGNLVLACKALLRWKYAAGYDCSTPGNKRCWGVWTRQLDRYDACMEAQQ